MADLAQLKAEMESIQAQQVAWFNVQGEGARVRTLLGGARSPLAKPAGGRGRGDGGHRGAGAGLRLRTARLQRGLPASPP